MKIAVLGLGVGYALSCAIAETGHDVVGIDIDPEVVKNPRCDKSVATLLKRAGNRINQRLELTTDNEAVLGCETVVVCVSTGDEKQLVLGNVEGAVRRCLRLIRNASNHPTILVYSTLPFGGSRRIKEIFQEENTQIDKDVSYCYMPLMIAQGTTADDFVNPPFIVFGSYSKETARQTMEFYIDFIQESSLFNGKTPAHYVTTPEIAEMAKLVANAFLSTKISFANTIAQFCETNDLDGKILMEIVGSDHRIGNAMLRPGYSFGGACFPRDLESLIQTFHEKNAECPILEATREVNVRRVEDPIKVIQTGTLGKSVLVLGTAYKAGVRDARGSPAYRLIQMLRERGFTVSSYDPNMDSNDHVNKILASRAVDVAIVTTQEPIFKSLGKWCKDTKIRAVLDYAGIIDMGDLPEGTLLFKAGAGWIR